MTISFTRGIWETMTLDRCRFFSQKYPENTLLRWMEEGRWIYQLWKFCDDHSKLVEIIALYVLKITMERCE